MKKLIARVKSRQQKYWKTFRRWEMSTWFLWFLTLTLLIRPWRYTFSQSDSVYFKFANSISHFNWNVHILNFDGAWPQSLLAAILFQLPIPTMVLANSLTWIVFGVLTYFFVRDHRNNELLVLGFFSFPVFAEFGASFMPDIYLCLILYFIFRWFALNDTNQKKHKKTKLIYFLSVLLVSQYPTALIFVGTWSLFLMLQRKAIGWLGFRATALALFTYWILPKSGIQDLGFEILFRRELVPADVVEAFARAVQLIVGTGLLLIPLFPFKPKRGYLITTAFMQFYAFGIIALCSNDFLSSASFPTSFLPELLEALVLSLGVWGWSGFFSSIRKSDVFIRGALVSTLVLCIFHAFAGALEIRFVLPIAMVWFLIWLRTANLKSELFGQSRYYVVAMTSLAVFLNLFNLNATEANWRAARELASQGNDPRSISAGKSWNLITYEPKCTESALKKVNSAGELKDLFTTLHLIQKVPEAFGDEAHFRYEVHPYSYFGFKAPRLEKVANLTPQRIVEYRVLGLRSSVAVFDTGAFVLPWCMQ